MTAGRWDRFAVSLRVNCRHELLRSGQAYDRTRANESSLSRSMEGSRDCATSREICDNGGEFGVVWPVRSI